MGPGLEESLYLGALCIELRQRQIPFERQVEVPVSYRDELVGKRRLDLLVGGRLVVELKAVEMLTPLHVAQVRTYLKITNLKLGLLINFNSIILKDGIKRVINPT
jgi:GxxExxY protein